MSPRRPTRYGLCAALASLALIAGCAPYHATTRVGGTSQPPSATPGQEPRSDRGNPPFYDVLGKRYYVLKTSDGYRATGIASWYGREFHGLTTSSGEPYNMHAMTAAHTTLPIPTWVEVTNLDNGKHVVVKVNDRGPFVDNRLIDLSYAAAQALDMVRGGTARVEVRALGTPAAGPATTTVAAAARPAPVGATLVSVSTAAAAPAPVAPARTAMPPARAPAADGSAHGQMFVQVGAFAERDNAVKLVDRLRSLGFASSFVVTQRDGTRTLHRVRLGPLTDPHEFDQISNRLRSVGVRDSRLVVEP